MARIDVLVTPEMVSSRYIVTDIGNLFFNVITIPNEINVDDVIAISSSPQLLKIPFPISIVSYNSVITPFTYTSQSGKITLRSDRYLSIRDSNDANIYGGYIDNSSSSVCVAPSRYIIKGTNAAYVTQTLFVAYANNTNYDYIQANTAESFGVYSSSEITSLTGTTIVDRRGLNIANLLYEGSVPPPPADTDPFAPGGSSDSGGGDGDFTPHGEDITDPEIPDVDAVSTGFITLFNPSVSELNSLASYMWSGGFDVNTFKKLFANPMDCILGLSILPKIVPNGGSATVLVGNISTGVSMTKAARQYIKYDCGSITISRFSNSFLDYEPYTKINLYLPFIGMHQISTDDVMNKTIQVKYTVDILSGACVAFVIAGGTTLYTFIGQCAASVPITSQDWSTMINGVLGAVGSIASMAGSIATGNIAGAVGGAASMAQNVVNSKPSIEHSGNMGGMGGMLGIKTPYVIIERPAQAIPAHQNAFIGYPAFVTKEFSDLSGYNEVYSTHLENISATESELREIESLLKSGVIF